MTKTKSLRVAAVSEAKLSALAHKAIRNEKEFNEGIVAIVQEARRQGDTEVTEEAVRAELTQRMQELRCSSD